jgi:lipopolysaccharide export system ATP-binding protein
MPILEVRGLVKYYGRRKVVDGVDFEVDVGEVVGLLGPNGAGKTTSFRMTTGQIAPNAGLVRFDGKDVTQLQMFKRARLGMGYLSQEGSVFRKLTVEQNILAVLEMEPVHRTLKRKLTRAERWQKTDEMLAKFGLTHLRKNNAARLSGGERRRLEIARCLVCDPLLILMDEPFTGIDPQTIEDIQQIVRSLRDQGIGILVTDHRAKEILDVVDRSYLIKSGKVLCHGTPQELIHDPTAKEAYLGNSFAAAAVGVRAAPASPTAVRPAQEAIQRAVQEDRLLQLLERLRAGDGQAALELLEHGPASVPALLDALERRDVEMRRLAFELLQRLLRGAVFDPYAPEAQRRQQLAILRQLWARKAG